MWGDASVHVVVPAYREERLLPRMLRRVPAFVDRIVVVDDGSDDGTAEAAGSVADLRIDVVRHIYNRGVGAAIVTGYRRAFSQGASVAVVMAADDQMHPDDLEALIAPVVRGEADYVKGNRMIHAEARRMPLLRRVAGRALAFATRRTTGLSVGDTQCGYTALDAKAAARLPLESLWPSYGYPNDLLGLLAGRRLRVREVPVRPVYADEESGVRPWHVLTILGVLARRRLLERSYRSAESARESGPQGG
jgi:glycosyltransferase involved in cell wall biosynthesis